tara:strand:- start:2199 stop:2492 length:294 start_codon:yes stop_codon:yes gene_type:complete
MEWLKGRLGQIIALAALVSTIAGFGYTGAGYVTRLEAVEERSGISYDSDLKMLADVDVVLEKDILVLKTQIKTLEEKVLSIQKKQDNSGNPLISIGR